MTWFDVGTYSSLLEASQHTSVLEGRQGQKIAWPDETQASRLARAEQQIHSHQR